MFIGLIVYWWDGRKYLPEESLHAPDPITDKERTKFFQRVVLEVLVLAIIVIVMIFVDAFTNR
ncbi:hypothetical protein ATN92_15350 [Companilactobacillus bobalius]|nr:hypothetical protein [Companilactobacillus bobalius]KAE9557538.1 hypothetical protein ATN92_15350 [Companilactobacillus bobalius]